MSLRRRNTGRAVSTSTGPAVAEHRRLSHHLPIRDAGDSELLATRWRRAHGGAAIHMMRRNMSGGERPCAGVKERGVLASRDRRSGGHAGSRPP